jgi:hypothetical protein
MALTAQGGKIDPAVQRWWFDMPNAQRDPRTATFLLVGGLAVAGTIAGQLGATSATTYASSGNRGITTGVFLALMLLAAGVASLWTSRIAAKWGALKVFAWAQIGVATSWTIVGIIEVSTDSSLAVLLIAAPVFGVMSGATAILTPFIASSYIDTQSLASSLSRRSAVSGVAAMLGAGLGGFLIHETNPGIGIVANGLLTIPLAVFAIFVRPLAAPKQVRSHAHPMRNTLVMLGRSTQLRPLALLTLVWAIAVTPMLTMIVPILSDLNLAPLPSGAGLMLAGVAAGRLSVPYLTKRLLKHHQEFPAALWAAIWTSGFMLAFASSILLALPQFELVVWMIIGVGIGASRFTFRPLIIGAAAKSGSHGDEMSGVAALIILGTFLAPVGVLLWGFMIDAASPAAVVAFCAVAMIAAVAALAINYGQRTTLPANN